MNHAMTLDLDHGHVRDTERPARAAVDRDYDIRGGKISSLEHAGMTYSNDRTWVPITMVLLAVMAILSSAMVIAAVLYGS